MDPHSGGRLYLIESASAVGAIYVMISGGRLSPFSLLWDHLLTAQGQPTRLAAGLCYTDQRIGFSLFGE